MQQQITKKLLMAAACATMLGGCDLFDVVGDTISEFKDTIADIQAAASGDLSASNAAMGGANTAVKNALNEAGASIEKISGGSEKPRLAIQKLAAMQDDSFDDKIEEDCDISGTISRQILMTKTGDTVDLTVTTTAEDCKLDLNFRDPFIASTDVQLSSTVTTLTISGEGLGDPDATSDDAKEWSVVFKRPNSADTDAIAVVPADSFVNVWQGDQIQIELPASIAKVTQEIYVVANGNASNTISRDLSKTGKVDTPKKDSDKTGLVAAQGGGPSQEILSLDGQQTVSLTAVFPAGSDGKGPPDEVPNLSLNADSWIAKIEVDGTLAFEQNYSGFSMSASSEAGVLTAILNGKLAVKESVVSFDATYTNLTVSLESEDLFGDGDDEDGDDGDDGSDSLGGDEVPESIETTLDGGIALNIGANGATCVQSQFEFETVTPLMTNFQDCPSAGVLIITEITPEGDTSVEYTFSGGNVSFSATDGETTIPCNALAGPGAACLGGIDL